MTTWRKSSYSQSSGTSDCVEVAALSGAVGVRDSKNPSSGHLALDVARFAELVARIKSSGLER